MLSWFKSTIYPSAEVPVAPTPKRKYKIEVDDEFLDTALKLVNEQHEMLKAVQSNEIARAEALAKFQGTLTDAQKQLLGATRSAEIQKEIDATNAAAKKNFGVIPIDVMEGVPLPRIVDSKILFIFNEEKTIEIDVDIAKTFYALSMTHDATTEQVDDGCALQVKAAEGEYVFNFPNNSWGLESAVKWYTTLKTLLSSA